MKRFIAALLCALTAAAFTSCKHDKIKGDDSSSQAPTGKKSNFIIEEVTD